MVDKRPESISLMPTSKTFWPMSRGSSSASDLMQSDTLGLLDHKS